MIAVLKNGTTEKQLEGLRKKSKNEDADEADKLAENFAKIKDCIVLMQSLIAFL